MEPVRFGVVGCGVIGPSHLTGAADSEWVEVVAVADLIEDRAKSVAERFNVSKTYTAGEDMLDDPDIEAVVLAFPSQKRTELALKALAKGKHVLVEKPVANNADEVKQMMAAQGDLLAATCCCRFRFTESAKATADFIATGALGDLRTVYCRELRAGGAMPTNIPPEWRLKKHLNGGGILMNWGCYDLDYLLGLCDWQLKPQAVFAQTWTCPPKFVPHIAPDSDAETYYTALVRCEGGVMLSIERGEYMTSEPEAAWQIIGTEGTLQMHMTAKKGKKIVFDQADTERGLLSEVIWEGDADASLTSPIEDLGKAIREGTEPSTSLRRALTVQQISDGVYASAASGQAAIIE